MEFIELDDLEMICACVFFGRIGDLKVFKGELDRLAAVLNRKIRFEDFQQGKIWIKRGGDND